MTTRAELEQLNRDALIARAEDAGVTRARVLTRPELVDELLLRSVVEPAAKQRARGFFGLARDLLARVVERGLNLPDAADTIRALGLQPPSRRLVASALPTVTLAEIYAAQGHRDRAIETLAGVLASEPDHAVARVLMGRLEDSSQPLPPPPLPPEEEEPTPPAASASPEPDWGGHSPQVEAGRPQADPIEADGVPEAQTQAAEHGPREPAYMLDDSPLPPRYDVDECVAMSVDPRTVYVYWEVRDATLAESVPDGVLAVRLVVIIPTWEGPQCSVLDREVGQPFGELFERDLPPGCVVRAAIGWKTGGAFSSIAHALAVETPPGRPSPLLADAIVLSKPGGEVSAQPLDGVPAPLERLLAFARQRDTLRRIAERGGASPRTGAIAKAGERDRQDGRAGASSDGWSGLRERDSA
jgi:hypothetical protein